MRPLWHSVAWQLPIAGACDRMPRLWQVSQASVEVLMKLLLIRHGESVANQERRNQGQLDSPLSPRGRAQALALSRRLAREPWPISTLYASDLSRAAETAQILAQELGLPLVLDARLREFDTGVLSGLTSEEIERQYPDLWQQFQSSPTWVTVPGAESLDDLRQRLMSLVDQILAEHDPGETVALVSHGGSLGVLLSHLLGLAPNQPPPFHFDNTSLSMLDWTARGIGLVFHNDTCHLASQLE